MSGFELILLIVVVIAPGAFFLFRYGNPLVSSRDARLYQLAYLPHTSSPSIPVTSQQVTKIESVSKQKRAPSRHDGSYNIEQKLRFAKWNISPQILYLSQAGVSAFAFLITAKYFGLFLQILALVSGPIFVNALLQRSIEKRSQRFSDDFPQFLLSVMGLLKTGMSTVTAIEEAASGLDVRSAVRIEVQTMVERMRSGVNEEQSVGRFAESYLHPEAEMFVQTLLISKRTGGGLSDSLERLAIMVRRRQYFKESASAAVALQRASVWCILGILILMQGYIVFFCPQLVSESVSDPVGWLVWQGALATIIISILWSREITNIRV